MIAQRFAIRVGLFLLAGCGETRTYEVNPSPYELAYYGLRDGADQVRFENQDSIIISTGQDEVKGSIESKTEKSFQFKLRSEILVGEFFEASEVGQGTKDCPFQKEWVLLLEYPVSTATEVFFHSETCE